jgi:hypothetical protein
MPWVTIAMGFYCASLRFVENDETTTPDLHVSNIAELFRRGRAVVDLDWSGGSTHRIGRNSGAGIEILISYQIGRQFPQIFVAIRGTILMGIGKWRMQVWQVNT